MKELKFYISALYLSLFSRGFYVGLIGSSRVLGLRYILLLAVLLAVPVAMEVRYLIAGIFPVGSAESLENIKKQIPPVYYENGEFKIEAAENRNIVAMTGEVLAVLDVERKIDDLSHYNKIVIISPEALRLKFSESSAVAVIMANEIYKSLNQYFKITAGGRSKFDTAQFVDDLDQVSRTPTFLITIFSAMWFFLKYAFSAFGFSFVAGMMMAMLCNRTIFDLRQCFRIAAFTATPVAFLEIISVSLGGGLFSYASLVYFITHMIYIHFAIESYKRTKCAN